MVAGHGARAALNPCRAARAPWPSDLCSLRSTPGERRPSPSQPSSADARARRFPRLRFRIPVTTAADSRRPPPMSATHSRPPPPTADRRFASGGAFLVPSVIVVFHPVWRGSDFVSPGGHFVLSPDTSSPLTPPPPPSPARHTSPRREREGGRPEEARNARRRPGAHPLRATEGGGDPAPASATSPVPPGTVPAQATSRPTPSRPTPSRPTPSRPTPSRPSSPAPSHQPAEPPASPTNRDPKAKPTISPARAQPS